MAIQFSLSLLPHLRSMWPFAHPRTFELGSQLMRMVSRFRNRRYRTGRSMQGIQRRRGAMPTLPMSQSVSVFHHNDKLFTELPLLRSDRSKRR